jgi:S1-C subfamily serine protease
MAGLLRVALLSCMLTVVASCNSPATAPASDDTGADDEAALLEMIERRVAEAIDQARESAVALEYPVADASSGSRRMASGVVINDQGDVLSVRIDPPPGEATIVARDASGRRHPARWVATDAETGLTLLRIDPGAARPARPSSRAPRLGSQVLIIGNPFGLAQSVSRGQVAGLDRHLEIGPRALGGLIQVDTALHPGDSGAMVADLRGEWLGMIRSDLTPRDAARTPDHHLGFAIPARDALWVADQLRERKRVDRAYLGVQRDPDASGDSPGAVLGGIVADTPAALAGLRAGDRIVSFDGRPIATFRDLTDRLDRTLAQAEVSVEYVRGPNRERKSMKTARRPPVKASPSSRQSKPEDRTREALERVERLERRLDDLERRPTAPPAPADASVHEAAGPSDAPSSQAKP